MFTTMVLVAVVIGWAFSVIALLYVYIRPPARSATAMRRRLDDLESDYATDHTELKRLVKRYRALEGHVYGSMEPAEDELAAPGGPNPEQGRDLALLPDSDFPEEEFQQLVAKKRGLPHA